MKRLIIIALSSILFLGCSRQHLPMSGEERAMAKVPVPDLTAMSPQEIMKQVKEAARPGPSHTQLQPLVGEWLTEARWWHQPGDQPDVSTGVASSTWVLGDRFVREEYKGKMMGEGFQGIGYTGYDNVKQQHVSIWMDSMSTGVMTGEGTYNPAARSMEMTSTYSCPITNAERQVRLVTRILDNNNHVLEMYDRTPEGQEFKTMEITYKRKS